LAVSNSLEKQKRTASVSFDDLSESLENTLYSESGFDENKTMWKLQLAIQQLPDKQKLVFNLRYFEEMPYEEISQILDTSVGALKASYHYAVKKIEEYMLHH
jgi:RNA polymerase sigma-70 factor (ECF subfamily)